MQHPLKNILHDKKAEINTFKNINIDSNGPPNPIEKVHNEAPKTLKVKTELAFNDAHLFFLLLNKHMIFSPVLMLEF